MEPSTAAAPACAEPDRARELPLAAWVAAWGVAWLTPFGVFVLLLIPAGAGMFGRSWIGGLHFALATAAGCLLFRRELRWGWARDRAAGRTPLLALAAAALAVVAGCLTAYAVWPLSAEAWARYEALQLGLVRMDLTYHAVKVPELLFQQALIYALTRRLQRAGFAGWRLVGAFALAFGAIHLPLVAVKGWAGVPFVLAATGASLVFPPLIARFRGGIAYSLCVHQLAYTLAGLALRAGGG